MPFAVQDFHDLVRLLAEHPEWRAELRRLVLSEELLTLPDLVRELAEAQRRAEERLARLEEGQARLEAALAALAEVQRRAEGRLGQVEGRLGQVEERVGQVEGRLGQVEGRLGQVEERLGGVEGGLGQVKTQVSALRGSDLERRYREYAPAYFRRLVRSAYPLLRHEVAAMLDDAEAQGLLREEEADDVLLADLVVRGRRREDGAEVYLVVEISAGIESDDVERAARRAALLDKVRPSTPVVAGERARPKVRQQAAARGVRIVLDGRTLSL